MKTYLLHGLLRSATFVSLSIACMTISLAQAPNAISALGFVEPEGGMINVSGPVSPDGASVSEIHVKVGDVVKRGDVLAVLDNHERLQASLRKALAQVGIHEARLARSLAGASSGVLGAHRAVISRISVELEHAAEECLRSRTLLKRKIASEVRVQQSCSKEKILHNQLAEAEANLAAATNVRPEEIAIRRAEIVNAQAGVAQAEAELNRALVRAPIDGQILTVFAKAGEAYGIDGIVRIGQTERMWVIAEVYETDVIRVSQGQKAEITSDGFDGTLTGTVKLIGLMAGKNEITATNPTADIDARVVEVKIKLNETDSAKVSRLSNLQVSVVIRPNDS